MAYTIYKTNGEFLTTIADGTINRGSTSVALPGRNYSGYGLYIDQDLVQMLENFAGNTVPANPIAGQIWYDTSVPGGVLRVCPADGTLNPADWQEVAVGGQGSNVSFGNISAENITGNAASFINITAADTIQANSTVIAGTGTNSITLDGGNGVITAPSANINSITTSSINGPSNGTVTSNSEWRFGNMVTFDSSVTINGPFNTEAGATFGGNTSLTGITSITTLNAGTSGNTLSVSGTTTTFTGTLNATNASASFGRDDGNGLVGNLTITGTATVPSLGTVPASDNGNITTLTKDSGGNLRWRFVASYSIANSQSSVTTSPSNVTITANNTQVMTTNGPTTSVYSNLTITDSTFTQNGTSNLANVIVRGNVTLTGGNATSITASTIGNITAPMADVQIRRLGVATAPTGPDGTITATNDITAFASDERLKNKLGDIENALEKVMSLSTFYFEFTDEAVAMGLAQGKYVGVSAQETQAVIPEIVKPAPVNNDYLTVQYDKFAPLLIAAIKELAEEVQALKSQK